MAGENRPEYPARTDIMGPAVRAAPAPTRWDEDIRNALGVPAQAADDLVRIYANAVSLGLADKLQGATFGGDQTAMTNAARDRAGIAGDIATGAGWLTGGAGLLKGAGVAGNTLRAAFGRGGAAAGQAISPRLLAKNVLYTAGTRAALPAAAVGLAYAARGSGGEMPPTAAQAAPQTDITSTPGLAEQAAALNARTPASPIENILVRAYAANPNLKITASQLKMLGSIFPGTPTAKPYSPKDLAMADYMDTANQMYKAATAAASGIADPVARSTAEAKAAADRLEMIKQLFIKPDATAQILQTAQQQAAD